MGAEPWGGYPGKCARQREQRARGGAPLVSSKRTRRPWGWCAASGGREKAQGGWGLPGPWRIRADLEFCSDFDFTLPGPFPEECFNAPFHASSQSPLPAPPPRPRVDGELGLRASHHTSLTSTDTTDPKAGPAGVAGGLRPSAKGETRFSFHSSCLWREAELRIHAAQHRRGPRQQEDLAESHVSKPGTVRPEQLLLLLLSHFSRVQLCVTP